MFFNKNDITEIADVTAEDIDNAIATLKPENGLTGLGKYFIDAQNDYKVNAIILAAIACHESGYGTSKLARTKNNLFGIKANDEFVGDDEKYGDYFATKEDCIDKAGYKLRYQYLEYDSNASYCYANGDKDLHSIGHIWCSDEEWADSIANLAERLSNTIKPKIDYEIEYFKLKEKLEKLINEMEVPSYDKEI